MRCSWGFEGVRPRFGAEIVWTWMTPITGLCTTSPVCCSGSSFWLFAFHFWKVPCEGRTAQLCRKGMCPRSPAFPGAGLNALRRCPEVTNSASCRAGVRPDVGNLHLSESLPTSSSIPPPFHQAGLPGLKEKGFWPGHPLHMVQQELLQLKCWENT